MKVSILIPSRNEAKSIYNCLISCLNQSYPASEIIVVNDASEDNTLDILKAFKGRIKVVTLPRPSGNKSYAQEEGLKHVTGDIVVTTDADTILDRHFLGNMVMHFKDPGVMAVAGYVKSTKHNWLTACRHIEYTIGQQVHKYAQSHMNTLFVIPGCAAAYRTEIFKKHIKIDHDTLTEDLDFTYKHHRKNLKIAYCKDAVVYTQDPSSISDYISQLRRWYGGSWQNIIKHHEILQKPKSALELSLIFCEGIVFPFVIVLALLFSTKIFSLYYLSYLAIIGSFALYLAFKEKRLDVVLVAPIHMFVSFINYFVFIEQFVTEVILNRNNVAWDQPQRRVA